jgi:Na+-translocating ferredoxin:NAD+ oxidoreductase RnfD subunit
MKLLGQPISSMYLWTVVLLIAIVSVSSYVQNTFPLTVIVAVAAALLIETAIVKIDLRSRLRLPLSAIITGMLIGIIAPYNAPISLVIVAVSIAMLSKFFIKFKSNIIFNPAAMGLLIALAAFGLGDSWWASGSYLLGSFIISPAILLAIAAYSARRLHASLSFITATIIIVALAGNVQASLAGLDALLFSVNFLFAFIMIADPKTSPAKPAEQTAYGAAMALLVFALGAYGMHYAFLVALLIGNMSYAAYRNRYRFLPARAGVKISHVGTPRAQHTGSGKMDTVTLT